MTAPQNGVASGLAKKTARNDADEDFLVDQEPSAEVTVRHRFQQQHTHRSTCCCHEAAPELESGFTLPGLHGGSVSVLHPLANRGVMSNLCNWEPKQLGRSCYTATGCPCCTMQFEAPAKGAQRLVSCSARRYWALLCCIGS